MWGSPLDGEAGNTKFTPPKANGIPPIVYLHGSEAHACTYSW